MISSLEMNENIRIFFVNARQKNHLNPRDSGGFPFHLALLGGLLFFIPQIFAKGKSRCFQRPANGLGHTLQAAVLQVGVYISGGGNVGMS